MAAPLALTLGLSRHHRRGNGNDWSHLLPSALAASLGGSVSARIYDGYDELANGLLASEVEIAWLPPLLHARATELGAVLVAVPQRGGWLTFRSAVLVRADAPWKDAAALRGVRAAWREQSSASGYLFPRLELAALGAKPELAYASERFYGSPVECAKAVERGDADLFTCYVTDPAAHDPARARAEIARILGPMAEQFRVLHITDSIPPDGFVVGPRVGADTRARIGSALHALHQTAEGAQVLASVLQADRLSPVSESMLRSLRSWASAAAARAM